jgi:two-component system, chemotaxis family, protein-glutamate methylesterase/glutaminase
MAADIVVVGASRGGLRALEVLLSEMYGEFNMPVIIVQHRGKDIETGLCTYLRSKSALPVSEPEDKEPIRPGNVYLAPRDYHLLIEDKSFALSVEPPVSFARPSIDVLFESAAQEYQERVIGVILTGSNGDGARGMAAIKQHGGITIVEDPNTAAHREMPDAALARMQPDWVLTLGEIGPKLRALCNGKEYVN